MAMLTVSVYKKLPSGWLCEWDEIPDEAHDSDFRCGNERTAVGGLTAAYAISAAGLALSGGGAPFDYAHRVFLVHELIFIYGIVFLLSLAAMSDIRYMIIPDQICAGILAAAIARGIFCCARMGAAQILESLKAVISGGLTAGGLMLTAGIVSAVIYKKYTIGFGDIKMITACGCLAGIFSESSSGGFLTAESAASISPATAGAWVYILTVFFSAVYFSIGILSKRLNGGDEKPLAPWISAAVICVVLAY